MLDPGSLTALWNAAFGQIMSTGFARRDAARFDVASPTDTGMLLIRRGHQ